MGSDKRHDPQAYNEEQPQHTVTLLAYQIARFPVTVAEYACFVRAGHAQPGDWQTQLDKLDHPVVSVSWYDAVAYAFWLARLTGQRWCLPAEAEWEKAARGTDGRLYPWGDTFDRGRANTRESGKGATTPVGAYPNGASPAGAQDMAGNVWEWSNSVFKPYPYRRNDGRELQKSTENCVLRGGSWNGDSVGACAAYRVRSLPVDFNESIGVRVALTVAGTAGG